MFTTKGRMNFRKILNIALTVTLLLPAGLVPPSIGIVSAATQNLEYDAGPISVARPPAQGGQIDNARPLSVSVIPGFPGGEMNSKPLSVNVTPSFPGGDLTSKPLTVAAPKQTISGDFSVRPVSVTIQPATKGDPDIVGQWHFDGDLVDSSGYANDGSPVNSPAFSSDKKTGSQSASFNGSSYVSVSDSVSLDFSASMTLEAWIKPSDINSARQILSKFGSSGTYAYQFSLASTGNLQVDVSSNGTSYETLVTTNSPVIVNTWQHVAAIFQPRLLKLYVNGMETASKTVIATSLKTATAPLFLGRDYAGSRYFSGLLDEVVIYKRALTAEEIAVHAGLGAADPNAPAPPVVDLVSSIVGSSAIVLSGSKTPGTSVWVNNKKIAPFDDQSTWYGAYGTLQPGANILYVTAVDSLSRQSGAVTKNVTYDNQPPTIESSVPANNTSTAKPVTSLTINFIDTYSTINLDASITGASVKNSSQQLVAGNWMKSGTKAIIFTPSASLPVDTYLVTVYPVDAVGNTGQQQIVFTNHDTSAPVTTVALSGTQGKDGWFYSTVTVTLSATDGNDGAGIDRIEYSLNGSDWNAYTQPFVLDQDGVNVLYYRAVDKSGNMEQATTKMNVALSAHGATAYATSKRNDTSANCDGSPRHAIDGMAIQVYSPPGCNDAGAWVGTNSGGDTWTVSFDRTRTIGNMRWMTWTQSGWTDPQSQPKNYYVEYTSDPVPTLQSVTWLPVMNLVATNTNGSVNQATAQVSNNTNGNWLYDSNQNWIIHDFTPVNATALRIRITGKVSGTSYGPALNEVEVYETQPAKFADIKINKQALVGMWHMDNNWQDASVTGNHGLSFNGATFNSNAKIGTNAGSFDGSNDYVGIPNSAVLHAERALTVMGWMYVNSLSSTWQNVFWKGNSPDCTTNCENREYGLWLNSAGSLYFMATPEDHVGISQLSVNTSSGIIKTAANTQTDGGWYHVAAVLSVDQQFMKIYVNGVEQVSGLYGSTTDVRTSSGGLLIGATAGPANNFNGRIDEVSVYKRALSPYEIASSYRSYSITTPIVEPVQTPTTEATITLRGTKPANTAIVVNGATLVSWDNQTTWQANYTLQPGTNLLSISAMDADGFHSQTTTVNVALDLAAPAVTGTSPANNGLYNTSVAYVSFNLSDVFTSIDLAATATGAVVTNSFGAEVQGVWTASGIGLNGMVTFTPDSALAEGIYSASINPTDIMGNHAVYAIIFTVDATPPTSPAIDPTLLPIRVSTKTMSGTKSADTTNVVVNCIGSTVGSVTYPTILTWTVPVSNLKEGSNTITAYSIDAAGNQSAASNSTVVVDTIPPSVPVVTQSITPTRSSAATITGAMDAGTYLFVNNVQNATDYSSGIWSYNATLNEGANTFTFLAQDQAGNTSQSVTVTVVRDITPPRIQSSTPAANSFTNQASTIDVVLYDDRSTVDFTASMTGASLKNAANVVIDGTWSNQNGHLIFVKNPAATMPDGVYTVTLTAADILGNSGVVSISFTLDSTLPTVQSLTMNPTSPHKAETVSFTVAFNEDMLTTVQPSVSFTRGLLYSTYTIPSGTWTSSKIWQGSYTFTTNNGDGTYTVKVTGAKDKAQNTMPDYSAKDLFVLDTTPPSAPGLNQVTTPTNNRNQVLSGSKEAGSSIYMNGVQKVSADANLTWSYNYPLTENQNNLSITTRDEAGNDSPATTATIVLDTTPPGLTVTFMNPSSTATQSLTGTKESGCIVKLNNTQIFGSDDTSTTWSYTVALTSGITNHFVFMAMDALGNTTTKAVDILYDNAPPAPLGPGVLTADGNGKGTEITLSWAAYPENSDVAYYAVYKSSSAFTDVSGMTPVSTVNKGTKTYKSTGLTQGGTYYFAIVPVDLAGNQINTVNVAAGTPTDTVAPEDLINLTAVAGYSAAQSNIVMLSWTVSVNSMNDLADQMLYVDNGNGYDTGTSLGKTATTFTKSGLLDATKYKFKLTVRDTLGHESQGVIVEAMTRLANPANLASTTTSGKAMLSWSAVSSAYVKQYNVYRKTSTTQQSDISTMSLVGTSAKTAAAFTDTGLTNDTTYQYAVTVLNTSGAERSDVQSVAVVPKADSTGPVIDTFNITSGQVIAASITITATAHDVESSMAYMELFIDGTLISTQGGGSLSYFWNTVAATDGNHTIKIKATDSKGNPTEDSRQVSVSLAPPGTPIITGSIVSQTTPSYIVTVTGTAPLFSTVTLRVNGVAVTQMQTTGTTPGMGTFNFSLISPAEGDNLLAVKASHRGGDSPYSADYKITVDTGAPPAPIGLAAQVLAGGLVRFTWMNATGEIPTGYNLYASNSSITSKSGSGVTKTNATPITYLLKEYIPNDDGLKYYAVTALDSAGNESGIGNVASVASDRAAPSITSIQYMQNSTGISPNSAVGAGSVKVTITASEPLKELPFFSLESAEGSPIVVTMNKTDDTHYEGSISITAQSPQGSTTYKFSGKDIAGNRGNAQGVGIGIDVQGPEASILSPLTTQQIINDPVIVKIVLNEPSMTTPTVSLKATDNTTSLISNMTSTDNGIHWTGALNLSAMPEGKAEFMLANAQDIFGNVGSTVSTGKNILLYRNGVAPPGIPDGLTTKSGKAGVITLTWYPVVNPNSDFSTLTYNLYRRVESETSATKIQTGIGSSLQNATLAQDIPPVDGVYYYSVTSVGLMGSESPASTEAQALSDRTGPPAPNNLALSLGSGGVTATWDVVVDSQSEIGNPQLPMPLKGYNLYRSNAPFTSSSGLTPVSKTANALGVDTSPSKTYRFYAVAAVDSLGNEGPLSAIQEIDFPVSPVVNLVLQKIDDAAPTITWQSPQDGTIAGYNIYRNGSPINSYPVPNLSYTDAYAASGMVYGVSAVDNLGNESPVKTVTLPALTFGLKDGTTLRRGILETVPVIIFMGQGGDLTIDTVDVKVGTAPISSIQGPFVLGANTTLQLEKVAATTADAMSPVSVFIQANWSPSPGVSVKISRTVAAEVLGASTSLEIFNDPLVRNTDAKVRLKLNNIGTSQMEFVTSESNGKTTKVKINLKDQDGNLLSTGYLDQRVGAAIVNGAGYAVARLDPNTSMTTEPIMLPVPASAPNAVVIEAVIDNIYYHYSKSDQVTAPGLKGTASTVIQDTPYRAVASPEKGFFATAQPVVITGSAISNDAVANGQLVPSVPIRLGISVRGFDRFFTVTTDGTGKFSYTFTPASNEAGDYNIWAVHPDVKDRTVQAIFSIAGMAISPTTANVTMARNRTQDISVTLQNYGGGSLTGLTFDTTASSGMTVSVINNGDTILTAGEKQGITFRISTDSSAPDTGSATFTAKTTEGLSVALNVNITVVNTIPVISTSPSYIDTGMVRGSQQIASFSITNSGQDTLRNARIDGPSTTWMVTTIIKTIGDIAPGASATVGFMFSPPETLTQGVYDDQLVIYSDNHIPYTYHIQVTVTSNAIGSVYFDVMDELMQHVQNATLTLQSQTLTELLYSIRTGADGTVMKSDIPEGRYVFNVSAPGHKSFSGSFIVLPGITTAVPIALEVNLVTVEWSVTPIVIEDRYDITITQTFQTNVPTPVLVTEPPGITLPDLAPGEVFNGEFTVANYGLISLNEVSIQIPASFGEYDVELLTLIPKTIGANQKVSVLYRVTRKLSSAMIQESIFGSHFAFNPEILSHPNVSLFTEVMGYGGSCYNNSAFKIVGIALICQNKPQQSAVSKSASYTLSAPIPGSDCSPSTNLRPAGGSSSTTNYGSSIVNQSGAGGGAPSGVSSITPVASSGCDPEPPPPCHEPCCGNGSGSGPGGPGGPPGPGPCGPGGCNVQ